MQIELVADKSHFINHDLNFAQERYESKHVLVCFLKVAYLEITAIEDS